MSEHDKLVYLAAILDGEGSVQIEIQSQSERFSRKTNYYSIRLLVTNTYKPLMDWLESNFGGKLSARKDIPNRKRCYKWNLCSFKAAELLKRCRPFMMEKRRHADLLIEFMETKPKGTWNLTPEIQERRKYLYEKLKKYNRKEI